MTEPVIIFDLDDTLIQTQRRHYEVYKSYMMSSNVQYLTYESYILLRARYKLSNYGLVKFAHEMEYPIQHWLEHIESIEFLVYDEPIVNYELLNELHKEYKLILLSLRTKTNNALKQFRSFEFHKLFDEVYFIKHIQDFNPKIEKLTQLKSKYSIEAFVGDSQGDMEASLEVGINFVGVETGLFPIEGVKNKLVNVNQIILKYEFRKRNAQ